MNKELGKVCDQEIVKYHEDTCKGYTTDFQRKVFKEGFQAAIESEQVQGLVEALNEIAHIGVVWNEETGETVDCNPIEAAQKALEKFRGADVV